MTAMIVWTIRQTQGPLRGKNGSDYSPNPGPLRGKNGSYDSTTPGPLRGKNGSYDSPTPGPLRVIVPLKIPYFYRNDEVLRNPICLYLLALYWIPRNGFTKNLTNILTCKHIY